MILRRACLVGLLLAVAGCPTKQPGGSGSSTKPVAASEETIISLFDGKSLANWKSSEFGGDGECKVEEGKIILNAGSPLTGLTWKGPKTPTMDYEIELDAMKVSGDDFFVGLTFPYNQSAASLILGGWGGSTTGISSLDGFDAANNETMGSRDFKRNKWYHVRVKVTKDKIEAWVDEDQVVDCKVEGRKVDVRMEVENAKPLGLCTYQTTAAYKNLVMRKLQ